MRVDAEALDAPKAIQMKATKTPASRPHDGAAVKMLKAEPEFADDYLAAALEEAGEPGGQAALLLALRHVAEAQA